MMRSLCWTLTVYLAFVLEACAATWRVSPPLVPLFLPGLASWALLYLPPAQAYLVASVAGLLWDGLSSSRMGSHVLLMLVTACLWRTLFWNVTRRSLLASALFVGGFVLTTGIVDDLLEETSHATYLMLTSARAASTMLLFIAVALTVRIGRRAMSFLPAVSRPQRSDQLRWLD